MNPSRLALGVVGLALVGLWYFAGGTQPPASQAADAQRVASPLAHENLSVYFVHGSDAVPDAKVLTLQEALDRDLAVVHETGNVNVLAVENRSSEYELFIQSGDIVKGGRQDRMVQTDMLISPNSGVVPLPAHCVEQGRWTNRGTEDARRFKSSAKCAVGNDLKVANFNGQQGEVWKTVMDNQGKLTARLSAPVNAAESPTSLQLALESRELEEKIAAYEAALKAAGENRADIIGVVFVINGQVTCAEVYGSNALFRKAWPKLLNAAAVEAFGERAAKSATAPSAREIERFLARAADPEPDAGGARAAFVPERMTAQMDRTNRRGLDFSRNLNEEVFQTEGLRPEVHQTEGRAAQTEGQPPRELNRVSLNELPNAPAQPAPVGFNPSAMPDRAGQVVIEGNTVTRDRVQLNRGDVVRSYSGEGRAAGQPAPANRDGNRLNSNRAENNSALTVESRDPNRNNAVIHKSYIKK